MTTPKVIRYTIVSRDRDNRAAEMVRDPKGYFSQARQRARGVIRRDVARGTTRRNPAA